jgi:hypothetical protein
VPTVSETSNFQKLAELSQRRVSRARFLRLTGAAAGLSLTPLATSERASDAQTEPSGEPEILTSGEYPIGIWGPPPPEETSPDRYKQIKDAGFNFVIGGNGVTTDRHNPAALDAAAANGLGFLLVDRTLRLIIDGSTQSTSTSSQETEAPSIMQLPAEQREPESTSTATTQSTTATRDQIRQRIAELLESYGGHPALAGFNMYDEPHKSLFGLLEFAKTQVVQQSGGIELPYVNIWPSYASPQYALGTSSYETYVERYCTEVTPPVLCFDHYPLLSETKITSDYFYNWAVIRKFSGLFGIPSWVFIQSVGFDGNAVGMAKRRTPNEHEIFWQINVSLAYGAKGIQYFTYWTPDNPRVPYQDALISKSEPFEPTPRYYYAMNANKYLSVIGKVLLPLTSESVVHAKEGKRLPRGAKAFKADSYVRAVDGSRVILGRFLGESIETNDRYLFVANRSFLKAAETRLTLSDLVSGVSEVNSETGELQPVTLTGTPPRNVLVKIAPGRARLYLLQTG